jgi:hypothetical protein
MKAIFPDSKSLQPMPTPDIHANVSGSVNNNTVVTPSNDVTTQNTSNIPSNVPNVVPVTKNSFTFFYFIAFMIVVVIIIITHKRLKKK